MKRRIGCVISAAVAVLLIIVAVNYAFRIGEETKIYENPVKEAAQSKVVMQDFIHDNYVISERNPWTDYSLHPIEYISLEESKFGEKINAGAAVVVDIKLKTVLFEKNKDKRMYPASTNKLMTALTVFQTMNLNDVLTI